MSNSGTIKDCGTYWLSLAEQGSDEWHRLRQGRITASRVMDIALDPKNLHRKVIVTEAMKHGRDTEPIARQWYQEQTGNEVVQVGIAIPKWDQRLGASPDGLVGHDGMIEIKCPMRMYDAVRVYSHLSSKGKEGPNPVSPPHYAQIQMNLRILERQWCDYVVYTERDKFIYRVQRDNVYWDRLYKRLQGIVCVYETLS